MRFVAFTVLVTIIINCCYSRAPGKPSSLQATVASNHHHRHSPSWSCSISPTSFTDSAVFSQTNISIQTLCINNITMNSTKVQNPRRKKQVALLAEPKTPPGVEHVYWRAGASLPSRPNGAIFLFIYIYISGVDVCRNVLRNSK